MTATGVTEDPDIFLSIENLELAGRGIADSVWTGAHRSRTRGPGVEFENHRDYQAGDDLRRVNWALYARQRRLFTRESIIETRRPVYLLIDASGSMNVAHGKYSKFNYATRMAASLAFLAVRQGDAPALGILTDELNTALPPGTGNRQALQICAALSGTEPKNTGALSEALANCRTLCQKKGFVILISDFFDGEDTTFSELTSLRAQGHDVLALQVLDPYEVEIPKSGDYEFIDTETGAQFKTSAEPLHESHARAVADWREKLKLTAAEQDLRWESITTNDSLVEVVRRWLDMV